MDYWWVCTACNSAIAPGGAWCVFCSADLTAPGAYDTVGEPPEFHYIAVTMGTHGGHAHVAPDIDPATFAALARMMDAAYAQAVQEAEHNAG